MEKLYTLKGGKKLLGVTTNSHRCSMCGMINAPKGALYECECGLRIDRQLNGAINLYLQMECLSPSPRLFNELMVAWSGFTLTGEKADESQELCVSIKDYVAQNPTIYDILSSRRISS